ncbi:MAG: DUF2955 domain-containing protein [Gammaproteobacteria bacterium]|nr:DUF2955 domain-containing protein [Gammaproteobacteria bacterium]
MAKTATDIANRRILRLALGTSLCMAFALLINWPLSFMSAVFTMFLLALPLPPPTLKSGVKFVVALVLPAYAGMLLLPFLEYARWSGVLLVMLALFGSFYYSARGGSPIMGMFMTLGITMVVTVGSISSDIMLMVVNGIAIGAACGIAFFYLAHALLPDLSLQQANGPAPRPPAPPKPALDLARRTAFRSWVVVLPLVVIFLFSSSSTSYVAVMIKVASMGQQASSEASRSMGMEQIESTLWGGLGAIVAWQVMSIWPSLLLFILLIGLACLLYGKRIFWEVGMHPKAGMWSYALLTMIILITPAVMDSQGGSNAAMAFYTRLLLFVVIAIYGTVSVAVFDTFWPARPRPA